MIELKSLKKLSILLIVLQSISFSTLNAQNKSPLNVQEKLDSLKTSLNEVTIMELGGMVKISQEIKGFENDKFVKPNVKYFFAKHKNEIIALGFMKKKNFYPKKILVS